MVTSVSRDNLISRASEIPDLPIANSIKKPVGFIPFRLNVPFSVARIRYDAVDRFGNVNPRHCHENRPFIRRNVVEPDDLAGRLIPAGSDLARAPLEDKAVEAYRIPTQLRAV